MYTHSSTCPAFKQNHHPLQILRKPSCCKVCDRQQTTHKESDWNPLAPLKFKRPFSFLLVSLLSLAEESAQLSFLRILRRQFCYNTSLITLLNTCHILPLQIPKICFQFETCTVLLHLSHRRGTYLKPPRDFLWVSVNAPAKQRASLASGKLSQAR